MTTVTVRQGKRYRASIKLGLLEQLADNGMIEGKLRAEGFADVCVSCIGALRTAEAVWPNEDASAPLPSQVSSLVEIA